MKVDKKDLLTTQVDLNSKDYLNVLDVKKSKWIYFEIHIMAQNTTIQNK